MANPVPPTNNANKPTWCKYFVYILILYIITSIIFFYKFLETQQTKLEKSSSLSSKLNWDKWNKEINTQDSMLDIIQNYVQSWLFLLGKTWYNYYGPTINRRYIKNEKVVQYEKIQKKLKIYIYELPTELYDWSTLLPGEHAITPNKLPQNPTPAEFTKYCLNSQYNNDIFIHQRLLKDYHRTMYAHKADFFYVPIYPGCFAHVLGTKDYHYQHYAHNYINQTEIYLQEHYPQYVNRHYGKDHIITLTKTFLAPDIYLLPEESIMNNFTKLSLACEPWEECQECIDDNVPQSLCGTITIPHTLPLFNQLPDYNPGFPYGYYLPGFKTHLACLANASSDTSIIKTNEFWTSFNNMENRRLRANNNNAYSISNSDRIDYYSWLSTCTFCLVPYDKDNSGTQNLVDAIITNCIPVEFGNNYEAPFSSLFRLNEGIINIKAEDIPKMDTYLRNIPLSEVLQRQEMIFGIRRIMTYGNPYLSDIPLPSHDAIHWLFVELSQLYCIWFPENNLCTDKKLSLMY